MRLKILLFAFTLFFVSCSTKNDVYVLLIGGRSFYNDKNVYHVFDNNMKTFWKPLGQENNYLNIVFTEPVLIQKVTVFGKHGKINCYNDSSEIGQILENEIFYPEDREDNRDLNINLVCSNLKLISDRLLPDYIIAYIEIKIPGDRKIIFPKIVKGSIEASSVLKPESHYFPGYLFDGLLEKAWSEGVTNSGEGEWVAVHLEKSIPVDVLYIANGLQKSEKIYYNNCRVKKLSLYLDRNKSPLEFNLPDKMGLIKIKLPENTKFKDAKFVVDEVYPGKVYKDLNISEIIFSYKGRAYHIDTGLEKVIQSNFFSNINNTIMKKIINTNLNYYLGIFGDVDPDAGPRRGKIYNYSIDFYEDGYLSFNLETTLFFMNYEYREERHLITNFSGYWEILTNISNLCIIEFAGTISNSFNSSIPARGKIVIKTPDQSDFFEMTNYSPDIYTYLFGGPEDKKDELKYLIISPYFTNIFPYSGELYTEELESNFHE